MTTDTSTQNRTDLRALGSIYEGVRGRIVELVSPLEEAASIDVAACPGWSLHDLVAHLSGTCADVISGNLDGLATPRWTAAQVEARKDRPFAELLSEWNELGPQIAAMVDDFPPPYGPQAIGDLTVHEHDVRGALGRPGFRDSEGVAICTDFVIDQFVAPGITELGLEALELRAGRRIWLVGAGEPAGTVSTERFELFRALTGRRSPSQIRRFDWTVDPEPYLPIFGLAPFETRPTDLDE